jgi:chemotaxis signal transduction protein
MQDDQTKLETRVEPEPVQLPPLVPPPLDLRAENPDLAVEVPQPLLLDAEEFASQESGAVHQQYCIFRAGRERFCFSVLDVEEVVEWPRLAKIPLTPSFMMGIFSLRGSIVPVVDIAFTEGRRADLAPKHVVVASLPADGHRELLRVGIAADEVIGTCSTSEPLSQDEAPHEVPHCCGILHHEGRMALALDLKKLVEAFPVPVI